MSPRELYREIEAARLRKRDEAAADRHLAWLTANFTGLALVGKLPSHKEAMALGEPKKQTRSEFATMARLLASQYGHQIIPRHVH